MPNYRRLNILLPWFLVLLLGAMIRLYHLGTSGLDLDEIVSVGLASRSGNLALIADTNPPLFLATLRGWLQLLPQTEFWIRFPAFLFSMLSLALMMRLCFSQRRSELWLAPALLLALSPASLETAQWARGNALWELTTTAAMSGFILNRSVWLYLGIASSALTHWFSFPISLGLWLGLRPLPSRQLNKTLLFTVITCLFFILTGLALQASSVHLDWQKMRFQFIPLTVEIKNQLNSVVASWSIPLIFLLSAAVARFKIKERQHAAELWLLTIALIYAAGLLGASLILQRSLFMLRYLTPVVPLLCWSLPRLMESFELPKLWNYLFFVFWLAVSVSGILNHYERPVSLWREGILTARQLQPQSIWTTRSLSIAHPYLEKSSIDVQLFFGQESDFDAILQSAAQGRTAIIDNFWGSLLYWENLKTKLSSSGAIYREYEFSEHTMEPIRLLVIEKKTN